MIHLRGIAVDRIKTLARVFCARFSRSVKDQGTAYIGAQNTIQAAKQLNLSVRDYLEQLWDQQGCTERVIDHMRQAGCFSECRRIVEIGPGTGRYLELVLRHASPQQYDIYETALDWAEWLEREYSPPVVRQLADGYSLKQTPDNTCGLVHAHGVFVYLPLVHCFEYFLEMMRVCGPQGYIVFDYYSAQHFDSAMLMRCIQSGQRYPVVLPDHTLQDFFRQRDFVPIQWFENKHGSGLSQYIVFRNDSV
jgi:phospholipid N-methyltransferase